MNIITEYNKTGYQAILREFISSNVKMSHNNGFIYYGDKEIAKDEGSFLRVTKPSKYFEQPGDYFAFDLFVIVRHNGDEKNAFIHLFHERDYRLGREKPFIRVGIDYFKKIKHTDRYGIKSIKLKKWNRQELKGDFGEEFKMFIDTFDDFIIEPNNIDYRAVIGNLYNLYAPFPHKPYDGVVDEHRHLKWTMVLMKHIFGTQWGTKNEPLAGIKYMKILYADPKQPLPILSLVSKERGTGKSTFIDYLTQVFSANMNVIKPETLKGTFNGSYALKNIVAIEETQIDDIYVLQKLKAISTQKTMDVNEKFIQNYTVPYFGKIIIASNDDTKFVKIDDEEIRYWVRKIPPTTVNNPNILNDLTAEIPYFLKWLLDVPEFKYEGRQAIPLWETDTDQLAIIKKESKTWLYKEMYDRFESWFYQNSGVTELNISPLDVKDYWYSKDSKINTAFIRTVLKNEFELEMPEKTTRYSPIDAIGINPHVSKTGRPYLLKRSYFNIDDEVEDNSNKDELPF